MPKQFCRWRALPGCVSAGRFIAVFHCECIAYYEGMSFLREKLEGQNVLILPLTLGLYVVKTAFVIPSRDWEESCVLGFHGAGVVGACPFTASSVLSKGWVCSSTVSGREALLWNVSSKSSASGFESQGHHLLAVWPSASYSTPLGFSREALTCQMAVPALQLLLWVNTYRGGHK